MATIFYFSFLFKQKLSLSRIGTNLTLIGLISHTLALVFRTIESGHAPFTNMYESLSFLSWATVLALVIVVALMAIASSPLMPKEATPLVPALQSYWLWLHVSVTLLGEGFFAIAFITSLLYLIAEAKTRQGEETTFSPSKLDSLSYRLIAIGFPLFTLGGLIFGMIWAYRAWGSYWSWDPKEVWSLITWFVFALYLHTRLVMGWQGRRSAFIAILGFLAALFTYFGVNYLISGLHSYV